MSQLKKHILRKTYIVVGSFLLGVTTTVFAAVGIDVLSIAERASSVIDEFRSEASKIEDQKTYYSLARADLALLYNEVDRQLAELAGETQNSSNNQSQVIESKVSIVGPGPGTGSTSTQNVCGIDSSPSIAGPAVRRCNPTTRQWYTENGNGNSSSTGNSTQSQSSCNWSPTFACGAIEFQCIPENAGKTTACLTCNCAGVSTTKYTSDAALTTITTSYKKGQKLYGYVEGGDLDNVWACIDIPGANSCITNNCSSGYEQGTCPWRQLTKNYTRGNSDTSGKDGWQKNGNRIELKGGLTIETSWPTGTYYGYTRNGINGTVVSTYFRVEDGPNPITVFTDSSLVTSKSIFFKGEKLYGYISGGNPDNTWGCTDIPGETKCVSSTAGWRQLTKPYPGVITDDWQKNPAKGNRIELKDGFMLFPGFPTGVYKSYTRDGINGTPQVVNFEVKERVMNCSWGTTVGGCDPGICDTTKVGTQACRGTCRCN